MENCTNTTFHHRGEQQLEDHATYMYVALQTGMEGQMTGSAAPVNEC